MSTLHLFLAESATAGRAGVRIVIRVALIGACVVAGVVTWGSGRIFAGALRTPTVMPTQITAPDYPGRVLLDDDRPVVTRPPRTQPILVAPPTPLAADVLFDTDSSEILGAAEPNLRRYATQLKKQYPRARLLFVGHTDSRGPDDYNLALSIDRASAVRLWFAQNGFELARLSADGAGETQPVCLDTDAFGVFDDGCGARNRRVDVVVLSY